MIIKEKFKSLIPPLSTEELAQLEQNCLKDGIRDPLVIWPIGEDKFILIDGHNRYAIAKKHGLPYETVERDFYDDDEAIAWIITNQIGRRNLSAYDRSVLALKLKPTISEKAKKQQGTRNDICQKSDKSIDTKKQLAAIAGVSHDTVHKVEVIEGCKDEKLKELVKAGRITINQAYNAIHEKKRKKPDPVKQAKREHKEFQAKKQEKVVSFEDIQNDKENTKILDVKMLEDMIKMFNTVSKFNIRYRQEGFERLPNVVKEDEKAIYAHQCDRCIEMLARLKKEMMR